MTTLITDSLRIVKASERLGALLEPLNCVVRMTQNVREIAPELEPELAALDERMADVLTHLSAAIDVLQAQAELL